MTSLAYPVHKAQSRASQQAITKVIVDQDHRADANRFSQKVQRIRSVMEDVNKQNSVKTRITMRNSFAIEWPNWNVRMWAHEGINALDGHVRSMFHDEPVNQPISTADIKDPRTRGD